MFGKQLVRSAPALLVAAVLFASATSADDHAIGRVVQQQGDVRLMRGGSAQAVGIGSGVRSSDRILTGPDGRIKIEFADRSLLAVGSNSDVLVARYAVADDGHRQNALLVLLSGIIRTLVPDPRGSFDISSRAAVASARSTEWLMEAAGVGSAVFAVAGTVTVQSVDTNAVVALTPGMGTDVPPGAAPSPPKLWGQARVDSFIARTRLSDE